LLSGLRILDLGCGSGRDCYLLAQLVVLLIFHNLYELLKNLQGEKGSVVGVDMTEEQLTVARESVDWHRETFGYEKANTEFVCSYIEQLDAFPDESFDVVVSNCVVNLSPDKAAVLRGVYRVLKPGNDLFYST